MDENLIEDYLDYLLDTSSHKFYDFIKGWVKLMVKMGNLNIEQFEDFSEYDNITDELFSQGVMLDD